jgi:FMN phosphatase YigB (HAD superfamily)
MIGVAFALHEALGKSYGTERIGFERAVSQFAAQRGLDIDPTALERIARCDDLPFGSTATLREAFSAAFGPSLLDAADATWLEALFRMTAAGAVGESFVPYVDVAPMLHTLAEMHVPRVALSAGWPSIDQRKADLVGFDGTIVFAQDLDVAASSPAAFARVADTLKLPADRIWFVAGDARREILPAAAAGMRTVWVNRDSLEFPAGRTAPDATIVSFAELFHVLREPYTRGLLALRHILRTALDWRPGHFLPTADDPPATGEQRSDARSAVSGRIDQSGSPFDSPPTAQ